MYYLRIFKKRKSKNSTLNDFQARICSEPATEKTCGMLLISLGQNNQNAEEERRTGGVGRKGQIATKKEKRRIK